MDRAVLNGLYFEIVKDSSFIETATEYLYLHFRKVTNTPDKTQWEQK
jgi:hypothetical protein